MADVNGATVPANNIFVGRVATHLDGFATLLGGQGYAPATIRQKNGLLADFDAWLVARDVPLDFLGRDHAGRFLAERRCPARRGDAWTIWQLLDYLRDIGCIAMPARLVDSTAGGRVGQRVWRIPAF